MMDPEETEVEEIGSVPSSYFENSPSPVTGLGGWASGAGNALFAVTKGVSSRVEGVSFRMSARAKGMLSSVGDDDGGDNGRTYIAAANGEDTGPAVDEAEAERLAAVLAESAQLAEKVVAMNKMTNVLGSGTGKASQNVLRSAAVPLVTVLQEAEHFDPFFANACITCMLQVSEAQGEPFAKELVKAGAAEALIPLLHPRFELIRIQGLGLLGGLLAAERGEVCSRVVGVPTGMQALVDLLEDRWDEVRHEGVFIIAALLAGDPDTPPPVDLQNFVAFQEGFEKLFNAASEPPEQVSLRALDALRGALVRNPLSQKLFVSGGHLPRLPSLLFPIDPATEEMSNASSAQVPPLQQQHQYHRQPAAARRQWGWGGRGKDITIEVSSRGGLDGDSDVYGDGDVMAPPSPASSAAAPAPTSSSSSRQAVPAGGVRARENKAPVAWIQAVLLLLSALVGGDGEGSRDGDLDGASKAADSIRGSVGMEGGLMEAVCELALASSRAPATGGPTWAEYGVTEGCQRLATNVLAAMISSHSDNQALFARCWTRGAPIAVTLHGRKRLMYAFQTRSAVDSLLELWLAASLDASEARNRYPEGGETDAFAEVESLDKVVDAFLVGNKAWCVAALKAVSSMHASSATRVLDRHDSSGGGVTGAGVLSLIVRRGLLEPRSSARSMPSTDGRRSEGRRRGVGTEKEGQKHQDVDEPTVAALSLSLLRRVIQAGGPNARALGAGIGIATEGAERREEARARRNSEMSATRDLFRDDGRDDLYLDDSGAPIVQAREREEAFSEDGNESGSWGFGGEVRRIEDRGRIRCGPPLTPALEVAMRLLANGHNVVVMLQRGGIDAGNDEASSPPTDLVRYLISLAELLVAWLSPPGPGPALSRRLLSSGANWALLRTLGRALRPASNGGPAAKKTLSSSSSATTAMRISADSEACFAYLHSLVAVIVGSFLSSAEALTRQTLSAGVAKHVGLFRFCRALDSATDWVAFVEPTPAGSGGGRKHNAPVSWALSGDAAFTEGMVAIVQAAQTSMIERIAGVPAREAYPGAVAPPGPAPGSDLATAKQATNGHADGGYDCDCEDNESLYEELLHRQQLRIEELERRLLPQAAIGGGRSPTLTI